MIIPNSVEIIDSHLDDFFEEEDIWVLHEEKSEIVHSDIFIVKPNEDREYNLLLTCGLSALPMNVPKEFDHLKYAEILLLLPSNWKLEDNDLEDENNFWVIRMLKQLSKYPHINHTWLGYGHTIPLNRSYEVDHKFDSVLLLDSLNLSEEFTFIESEEKEIYLYSAIPIYKEELDFKLEYGIVKLLEKFREFRVDEILDINRKNVCI